MLLITLFACTENTDTAIQNQPQEPEMVSMLAEQLTGSFDSSEQAASNPAYYAVSLKTCAVEAPELGDNVLYVEQALVSDQNAPYRQRLYVLEQLDADKVRSTIYSLNNDTASIGLCQNTDTGYFTTEDVTLREGCQVTLRWNGTGFTGQTEEYTCESTMNGASYATSIVLTTADLISSWDQGWDSSNQQVWGAVDGPYLFHRLY